MFYLSRGEQVVLVVLLALLLTGAGTLAHVKGRQARRPGEGPILVPAPAHGGAGRIVVRVSGAVAHPGIYGLPRSAQLADAVTAAGGMTAQADRECLDLSARVRDGEEILVPYQVPAGATDGLPSSQEAISLNRASRQELESLPGIGPVYAERIIAYRRRKMREEGRGFESTDELLNIPGIGPRRFAAVRDLVVP